MTFERSESTVELRTVSFSAADPVHEGLTAAYDPQVDVASVTFADIEGSTTLRIPGDHILGLRSLLDALAEERAE